MISLKALSIPNGHYIVAVSGGVDSIVLLNLLINRSRQLDADATHDPGRLRLTVAHYDHGIRPDSEADRLFVQQQAEAYGLPFVFDAGNLGPDCSEALAREKRYEFLHKIVQITGADGIMTAHHNDDVLETAIINMLRGTGHRGLASLKSTDKLIRPLLDIPKQDLIAYAKKYELSWREDSTNEDETYLRNYVRRQLMPKMTAAHRQELMKHIQSTAKQRQVIDAELQDLLQRHTKQGIMSRKWFIGLPQIVAQAIMVDWLKLHGASYDKQRITKLVVAAKTLTKGKIVDIDNRYIMAIERDNLALKTRER
ncbi:MAG: tRNA lysidine(34) synthetase TilS [Candidatus Saccharibacteria bacterium]|nr:tRNA lysidine(34) synthetase TilS [Candidatus Saccharibacteria bacterium]